MLQVREANQMTQAELFRPDGGPAFACTGKLVATCDKPYLRADDQVSAHLQTVALDIARRTGMVTADDLHDYPDLIGQRDGRVIGAVLRSLVRSGHLKAVGYVASKRAECHARPILQFEPA